MKKQAKKHVAIAKRTTWEDWNRNFNYAIDREKMFKVPKQVKKEKRDVQGANLINTKVEKL